MDVPNREEYTTEKLVLADGAILIPEGPGLGIELKTENFAARPYQSTEFRHYSGNLTDIRPADAVPYYEIR